MDRGARGVPQPQAPGSPLTVSPGGRMGLPGAEILVGLVAGIDVNMPCLGFALVAKDLEVARDVL